VEEVVELSRARSRREDETLGRSTSNRMLTSQLSNHNSTHDYSGSKRPLSTGRTLLYSDEASLANLVVETILKDNKVEDLRNKLSSDFDFNLFDAYLHFER